MKVLLDTSFLLPTLGIDVEDAEKILKKLNGHELYYSGVSILECLWIAISLKKKGEFKHDIYMSGMQSIFEGYKKAEVKAEISLKALELYELGHKDIIDCILYSTALYYNMKFASLDKDLKKFIEGKRLKYIFFEG